MFRVINFGIESLAYASVLRTIVIIFVIDIKDCLMNYGTSLQSNFLKSLAKILVSFDYKK